MDDDARPHRTADVQQLLKGEDITRMDWSTFSPDLKPTEHVRDALGRNLAERLHLLENNQQLNQMLIEEWALLPQELLDNLMLWRDGTKQPLRRFLSGVWTVNSPQSHIVRVYNAGHGKSGVFHSAE
ncbi:transposable element Tcb2 transposase [Trichonephila clavipes]|nr:transposable element Tcb2 transposase [Trichonephila clavipes]